jgi:PhnB protein
MQAIPYAETPCAWDAAPGDRIAHATLSKGAPCLMAADVLPGTPFERGNGASVMLQCESEAEIESLFRALGAGGKVTTALADTFWNARFGTLMDRYGVRWALNWARP